jgi:hypothetical protein
VKFSLFAVQVNVNPDDPAHLIHGDEAELLINKERHALLSSELHLFSAPQINSIIDFQIHEAGKLWLGRGNSSLKPIKLN